jgi:aspartate kinase
MKKVAFEEMLEMASLGAKVLQVRSVELAMVHKVAPSCAPVSRRSGRARNGRFRQSARNSHLRRGRNRGTAEVVTGIAYTPRTKRRYRCGGCQDRPGVSAAIFGPLADAGINVDMIVQNVSEDGKSRPT